jgi:hypothetical protein
MEHSINYLWPLIDLLQPLSQICFETPIILFYLVENEIK